MAKSVLLRPQFRIKKINAVINETLNGIDKAFIQHKYGKHVIQLKSIDYAFLSRLELYLKTVDNTEHNTAIWQIKNLKMIINLAIITIG